MTIKTFSITGEDLDSALAQLLKDPEMADFALQIGQVCVIWLIEAVLALVVSRASHHEFTHACSSMMRSEWWTGRSGIVTETWRWPFISHHASWRELDKVSSDRADGTKAA